MLKYGWHGIHALALALTADTEQRMYQVYTADCMGMVVRALYQAKDFKLFSSLMRVDDGPIETTEQVIDKILRKLGD